MKKNVLHVLRTYSLHGGEKQLSKVLKPNKFFNNFFLDLYKDKSINKFFKKKKILYLNLNKFYISPRNYFIEILLSIFFMFFNFFKILKILNSNKIDIVLCHGIQAAIIFQFIIPIKKKINFYYMHRILKHYRFYDFLSKIIYSRFKLILCNSNAVKKSLYPYSNKKKIKVVYNAVDINLKLKFKKKKKIILSVARLEKRKNLIFLLKVFKRFHKSKKNYHLYLLGDGPEKSNLQNYIKKNNIKNVVILGYKNYVNNYFKYSEIFVHTSLFEGMSNAVLEAMSYGVPSVVLNSPGVSELHVHNKTGFVSKRNITLFTEYLRKISDNTKIQKKFFINSRKRIIFKYSSDETLKTYYKYLK